jgi:hypothetical protein
LKPDCTGTLTLNVYNGLRGQRTETWTVPNAGSLVVPVEAYGSTEGPIRDLLNLRIAWTLRARYGMFRPNVEILNATNSAAPWGMTFNAGPRFGYYNNINTPRIARIGIIYEF